MQQMMKPENKIINDMEIFNDNELKKIGKRLIHNKQTIAVGESVTSGYCSLHSHQYQTHPGFTREVLQHTTSVKNILI